MWNGGLEQNSLDGGTALRRRLDLKVRGLRDGGYSGTLARIDSEHSNIKAHWNARAAWPDASGWQRLRAVDHLYEERVDVAVEDGGAQFALELPCPCVLRLRLEPVG